MEKVTVKVEAPPEQQEPLGRSLLLKAPPSFSGDVSVIDLSSSESDSEAETERSRASDGSSGAAKKRKFDGMMMANLPPGFLDPLPASGEKLNQLSMLPLSKSTAQTLCSRQFWKAGDFDGQPIVDDSTQFSSGMDHVRVHPKFLHSNATSHKWALGAFAELLDNSLDEVCNGATFVSIDMLKNKKDGTKMLLIEDNGGGMNPDKMRQCMSLGYSTKSKLANCIGQYGNGFKTSTMRLGADAIVFSCCRGEGKSPMRSIGMLSYTFLRNTGKEDIVVPMLDYEKKGRYWEKLMPSSAIDWNTNVDIIVQWSPYSSEADLLQQFDLMSDHGTRIVIYNLWEDDLGKLELDFDTDKHDIQIRGVNRDEKKIQMAREFPNSKHFLTYRHSLRSYASILYLRLPSSFKMILRGEEIEHHNIVNDMMLKQEVTYRPNPGNDRVPKDPNLVAVVTIGFVKDAKHHIDVQGFNVYHKNRLIKPFWRVWNAAGSDGRGVIGVLEANFVEPAHDKQGFERTTVLSRLETRLIQMQKKYWSTNCHKVGYAPRISKRNVESDDNDSSPEVPHLHTKKAAYTNKASNDSKKYQYSGKFLSNVSKKGKTISTTELDKAGITTPLKENGASSEKFLSNVSKKGENISTTELDKAGITTPLKVSNDSKKYQYSGMFLSNVSKKGKTISTTELDKAGITAPLKENGASSEKLLSNVSKKGENISTTELDKAGITTPLKENGTSNEKFGKSKGSSHIRPHELPHEHNESSSASENISSVPNVSPARKLSDKESSCPELLNTSSGSLKYSGGGIDGITTRSQTKAASITLKEGAPAPVANQSKMKQLEDENYALKQRLKTIEESMLLELQHERNKIKTLVDQLEEKEKKLEEANKEQEALIDIFSEERSRRDEEEATLRKKLKDAQDEISGLVEKLASAK